MSPRPLRTRGRTAQIRERARSMELVAWLKTGHGLGHGHVNALVAHVRAGG